jgi:hypothetical protein
MSGKNLTDWHRQQRKKQQQKNKTVRIAARDEKVKTSKTVAEVKTEIREIEKRYKTPEMIPHAVKSKLERLSKELKLVQEQALEQQKAASQAPAPALAYYQTSSTGSSQLKLEFPAVSIYYDAVMNPYGAPPPGKPALYHGRSGGTTMKLSHAIVPGQPDIVLDETGKQRVVVPPPPPTRPPFNDFRRQQQQQQYRHGRPNQQQQRPPPPPPANPPLPPPSNQPNSIQQAKQSFASHSHTAQPALPPPSAAVQRLRRSNLLSDIWASTEEVQYETVAGGSLEGTAVTVVPHQWWYQDKQQQTQGPFGALQMREWCQAGFFPVQTKVRSAEQGPWKTMQVTLPFQAILAATTKTITNKNSADAVSREERVVKRETSVQDRIAALRKDKDTDTDNEPTVPEDISVQARIEALRRDLKQQQQDVDDEDKTQDLVLDRITNLRGEPLQEETVVEEQGPPSGNESGTASVQAGNEPPLAPTPPLALPSSPPLPPPPPPSSALPINGSGDAPSYPIDDTDPIYHSDYPVEDDPYPIDDVAYPADDAYPVDNIPYPVNDAYPVADAYPTTGDYPVTDDYPETGDYPVGDGHPVEPQVNGSTDEPPQPPKKKFKGDQELVAFLPSHLQKKRRRLAKKAAPPKATRSQPAKLPSANSKSEKDDYERLMEEVEGL